MGLGCFSLLDLQDVGRMVESAESRGQCSCSPYLHVVCEWQPTALEHLFLLAAKMLSSTSKHDPWPYHFAGAKLHRAQPISSTSQNEQADYCRAGTIASAQNTLVWSPPLTKDGSGPRTDQYLYTYKRVATAHCLTQSSFIAGT